LEIGGIRFDWGAVAVSAWVIMGVYLDTWAHKHIVNELESFFTPWHAVLYSGLLAMMVYFGVNVWRYKQVTGSWVTAVPSGYHLSLIGIALFLVGGIGDMLWHIAFGLETGFDAGVSPTHLLIGLAIGLIVSGPWRAAWHRAETATLWPAVVSMTMLLSMFAVLTLFANPFVSPYAHVSRNPGSNGQIIFLTQSIAFAGTVMQTIVLMSLVLLSLRRWGMLPFGAITFLLTVNVALLTLAEDEYLLVLAAFLGGLVADGLVWGLKPSPSRPTHFHLFAFLMPAALYTIYFSLLLLTGGVWWSVHMWTGNIVVAGLVGWLVSYLILPPALP
jgi:hypothetical protein